MLGTVRWLAGRTEVRVGVSFSQELSLMDFPSGQGFYSRAGQVRPQHAWLESTVDPHRRANPCCATLDRLRLLGLAVR